MPAVRPRFREIGCVYLVSLSSALLLPALFALMGEDWGDALRFVAFIAALLAVVAVLFVRPWTRTETLEIDTRFVTVSMDDTVSGVWGRSQFTNLRLPNPPRRRLGIPFHVPSIVWGTDSGAGTGYSGGAGAGISRETASRLIEEINAFCLEHPQEVGFDYRGSGTAFG